MANIKKSIIKDSARIRKLIQERFHSLDLSSTQVVDDAAERGMAFTKASLSKYLNHGNIASTLSEENIILICTRWGITINLYIGNAVMEKDKIKFVLPKYNEEECLNNLKKVFNG